MKFGIFSCEGVSLWAAARLQDEGEDVLVYHAPPISKPFADAAHKQTGAGIVPLAKTYEQFTAYNADVYLFDGSDWGRKADALREAGKAVIGSSKFFDRLENDRVYAMKLAEHIGMDVPEYHVFGTVTDSIRWIEQRDPDEKWFFKSDRELGAALTCSGDRELLTARLKFIRTKKGDRIRHILQAHVEGIALSTSAYWNGSSFLRPWEGTLERKEFGDGDTGPKTGCSMNLIWMYPNEPKIVKATNFDGLAEQFRKEQAPPGIVDINAQLSFKTGRPNFLEFTPRFGYDSESTAQRLLTCDYGEFLAKLAEGTLPMAPFSMEATAMAIRLSVPPYPFESDHIPEKDGPVGLPLLGLDGLWGERGRDRFVAYGVKKTDGGYVCSDPHGLLGISSAVGDDLETMGKAVVKYAQSLGIGDRGYRTDAAKRLAEDCAAVRRAGYAAPRLDGDRRAVA